MPEILVGESTSCHTFADSPVVVTVYHWNGTGFSQWAGPYPASVVADALARTRDAIAQHGDWPSYSRSCLYGTLGYLLRRSGDNAGAVMACAIARQTDAMWENPVSCPDYSITPADKVRQFYQLIDQQRLGEAWYYLSSSYQATTTPEAWRAGYATTTGVSVERADEVSQAPETVAVSVTTTDLQNDQSVAQHYTGTWTLVLEEGVWKLDRAQIQQVP